MKIATEIPPKAINMPARKALYSGLSMKGNKQTMKQAVDAMTISKVKMSLGKLTSSHAKLMFTNE